MGYDMYSNKTSHNEGYFRLNIWGMMWMRGVIHEADPSIDLTPFNDNSGRTVSKALGKRIATALRRYVETHPVGTILAESEPAEHEKAVTAMLGGLVGEMGGVEVASPGKKEKFERVKNEDIELILDFARYNEEQTPYKVC